MPRSSVHPLHVHTHVHPADPCTLSAPRARSQVLEKEEENFPEIINLLERHATLEAANIDLTYRKDSAASLNEQMRAKRKSAPAIEVSVFEPTIILKIE